MLELYPAGTSYKKTDGIVVSVAFNRRTNGFAVLVAAFSSVIEMHCNEGEVLFCTVCHPSIDQKVPGGTPMPKQLLPRSSAQDV